jgi:hypothetical protein
MRLEPTKTQEEIQFMVPSSISQLQMKDDTLVSKAIQGNHDALTTLFSRYRRLLYSLAHRVLHNHGEAEDAVRVQSTSQFSTRVATQHSIFPG